LPNWNENYVSKSKQKGTSAETAVVNWLNSKGRKHVERRALSGLLDRGDIAGIPGVVIEVKNHQRMELSAWLKELEVEMHNDKVFNVHYWPVAREVVGHFYKKEQ
jgi:hypothetical protein